MDVLDMLKNEDDNPRGQTSRFRGGNTLEEAGEAEQRRRDIQAMRWPIMKQEAGIVHLIQAKNFFQRLQLPEPAGGRRLVVERCEPCLGRGAPPRARAAVAAAEDS